MYSQITSILYFSWAEIGTTGAPSAIVPGKEYLVMHKTSAQSVLKLPESQECKHLQELLNKSKDFHDLGFFNSNLCNDLFGYLRETSSSLERTSQFIGKPQEILQWNTGKLSEAPQNLF